MWRRDESKAFKKPFSIQHSLRNMFSNTFKQTETKPQHFPSSQSYTCSKNNLFWLQRLDKQSYSSSIKDPNPWHRQYVYGKEAVVYPCSSK